MNPPSWRTLISYQRRTEGEAHRGKARPPRRFLHVLVLPLLVLLGACIIVRTPTIREVHPATARTVEAPVRAFLADGSVVVFPAGARVLPDRLEGQGRRYDLTRTSSTQVGGLALDSVVSVQSFETNVEPALTVLASVGTTAVGLLISVFALCHSNGCTVGSAP